MAVKHACLLGLCWILLSAPAFADNPFETFYYLPSRPGPRVAAPAPATPPVELVLPQQVGGWIRAIQAGRYQSLGKSIFEHDWPEPHKDAAAKMGKRLGADLVLYAIAPARSEVRARRVVTPQWSPGEGGIVHGFTLIPGEGMAFTQGSYSSPGYTTWNAHVVPQTVTRYLHVAIYLRTR